MAKAKRWDNGKILFYFGVVAIPLLQFLIFYVGVNFNTILLAFQELDEGKFVFTAGFRNFEVFFHNFFVGEMRYAFQNSLIVWAVGIVSGTVLTILFSYYIFKKYFAYNFVRIILFLPSIIPGVVTVQIYDSMLRYLVRDMLGGIYLLDSTLGDTQLLGVIVYTVFMGFGSNVLLYSGAMGNVSTDILEASQIDGAGNARQLFSIVLPSIYPTITTFLVTSVAHLFTNQANLYTFFAEQAQPIVRTIGYELFVLVQKGVMSAYPAAATAGLMFTLVAAPLTLLVRYLLEKFGPSED
ncbi:MAG: sugar ABC transporter permease [Clostridia bacterium]|nr:sugar ABC transporter permease [Clostridia bacterium]